MATPEEKPAAETGGLKWTVCVQKQPLNKVHLCITAEHFVPQSVRYIGIPLYM